MSLSFLLIWYVKQKKAVRMLLKEVAQYQFAVVMEAVAKKFATNARIKVVGLRNSVVISNQLFAQPVCLKSSGK